MKEISVTSSFYAYLSPLSVIAHTLALIKNRYYGGTVDANAIATAALYHDITEVITGDLPTPIKYHSSAINAAYKQIEKQAELELLALLPLELRADFESLIHHDKLPEEHIKIIKAADKISAYLKCQAELKAGNKEFEIAAEQISLAIGESDQPEVMFFMQAFAPSCGLTLDGLMKTN
jgi:5'-deoxynucleotidase